MSRVFVGITGASGHAYALRLIQELAAAGVGVSASITPAGCKVLRHELGLEPGTAGETLEEALRSRLPEAHRDSVTAFGSTAVEAPPSSGTALTGGVVLCPCSMGTMARVAAGFSSNLVERAADVALKERRQLIVVPRETPLSTIHLENMLRLSQLGAQILPAMPGFYQRPKSMDDLIGHVVGKLLDALRIEHSVGARWAGLDEPEQEQGTVRAGGAE